MIQRLRTVAAIFLAATVAGVLGGCASAPSVATPERTPAPLSGVVATGKLIGLGQPDPIAGRVTVLADPATGALRVRLSSLTGDIASASAAELSAATVKPGAACAPYAITYSHGTLSTKADQEFILPSDRSPGWTDPSFLHSLILTSSAPTTTGCAGVITAYAPLVWSVGERRPDLHVVDHGARKGAEGSVVLVDGAPASYTVVSGDNLNSIARRFGLALNDLFYLNPARTPSPLDPMTQIGEVLNLSKSNR